MDRRFFLKDGFGLHVVLYQPEIPPNTGNIARLCVATSTHLHLIRPLGFSLSDRRLRRAGLDYWGKLKLTVYDSLEDFFIRFGAGRIFYLTTRAQKTIYDFQYRRGDAFVFGSESAGLPEELLISNMDRCANIPMTDAVRSLNLSDSVSIVLYEAIRQIGFSR